MPKNNTPRRKRMKRKSRLRSAKQWLIANDGKNIVKRYAKWYGVDLLCAIKELRLCGVEVSEEYETQLKRTLEGIAKQRAERKRKKEGEMRMIFEPQYGIDYDDYHAHIMGFTSGGASFGITWEEAKNMEELNDNNHQQNEFDFILDGSGNTDEEESYVDNDLSVANEKDDYDDLPF